MLVRLDWIDDFVALPRDVGEVCELLTRLGLAVDASEPHDSTWILDLDVPANRGDVMNHRGIAREIAAALARDLASLETEFEETDPPAAERVSVRIEAPDLCGRYTARVVEDVAVGSSSPRVEDRLRSLGFRPVNNVVDLTNYALLELGHPLHAFDLDLLRGETIVVRRARAGESIVTLDEVERPLEPEDLVIADAERPVAVAGVMGGLDTMITSRTRRVLLESAHFNATAVRATARRLGLRTDASVRFERVSDPSATLLAADRFCHLLSGAGGGRFLRGAVDENPVRFAPRNLELRWSRAEALLGVGLDRLRSLQVLEALGFTRGGEAAGEADTVLVRVPGWRPDVAREVDLIEEVARHHGYESIPSALPSWSGEPPPREPLAARRERLRDLSAAAGFIEVVNYAFISEEADAPFRVREGESRAPVLRNPLVARQGRMRGSLLPGLIEAASRNRARGLAGIALFEFGKRFWEQEERPAEAWTAAYLIHGTASGVLPWRGESRDADFYDLKGALEQILEGAGHPPLLRSASVPFLHPTEAAEVVVEGGVLGPAGRLHPEQVEAAGLEGSVLVAELDLGILLETPPGAVRPAPPSRFPWADRDLSLLVPAGTHYAHVEGAVLSLGQDALMEVRPLDRFRGPGVPDGRISLTIRLRYQRRDRTLAPEEANRLAEAVVECLRNELDAELRS